MSAKYKLVKRKDFSKDAPEDAIKYFAQLVNNGTVGFEEICGDVAEETALTSADVKSCIDRAAHHIAKNVKEGRLVQMGELGSFLLSGGSKGSATPDTLDAATMMKKPKVQYIPGKLLQDIRGKVNFERVKEKTEKTPGGGGEDDRPVIE